MDKRAKVTARLEQALQRLDSYRSTDSAGAEHSPRGASQVGLDAKVVVTGLADNACSSTPRSTAGSLRDCQPQDPADGQLLEQENDWIAATASQLPETVSADNFAADVHDLLARREYATGIPVAKESAASAKEGSGKSSRARHTKASAKSGEGQMGRVRWRVSRRVALLAAGLALLLVTGSVFVMKLRAPARAQPISPPAAIAPVASVTPSAQAAGASGVPNAAAVVIVHVVGEVNSPGIVELASGSRVKEAVAAAGGATSNADLAMVNLARVVVDGEQIQIPAPGEQVAQPGAAAGSAGSSPAGGGAQSGPAVSLNKADASQLDTLPGIGPVLAQRIVQWRTEHGRFSDISELTEVPGIGQALFARLQGLVTL